MLLQLEAFAAGSGTRTTLSIDQPLQCTASVGCDSLSASICIPVYSFLFQDSCKSAIETLLKSTHHVPPQCEQSIQFCVHDYLDLQSYFLLFRLSPTRATIQLLASFLQLHSFSISAFLMRCSEEFKILESQEHEIFFDSFIPSTVTSLIACDQRSPSQDVALICDQFLMKLPTSSLLHLHALPVCMSALVAFSGQHREARLNRSGVSMCIHLRELVDGLKLWVDYDDLLVSESRIYCASTPNRYLNHDLCELCIHYQTSHNTLLITAVEQKRNSQVPKTVPQLKNELKYIESIQKQLPFSICDESPAQVFLDKVLLQNTPPEAPFPTMYQMVSLCKEISLVGFDSQLLQAALLESFHGKHCVDLEQLVAMFPTRIDDILWMFTRPTYHTSSASIAQDPAQNFNVYLSHDARIINSHAENEVPALCAYIDPNESATMVVKVSFKYWVRIFSHTIVSSL